MQASWQGTGAGDAPSTPFARLAGFGPLAGVQVALLLVMTGSLATRLWVDHLWVSAALVAVTVVAWAPELTRRRARRWWFVYVTGIFVYTVLRSFADETAIPVRTDYVIEADQAVFSGTDPVLWLQRELFTPWRIDFLDVAAVAVHWSFFIAPHAAAIGIFVWRRELFPRFTVAVVGTMYVALVLFFLVPTAPPWLAGNTGDLPGALRVMDFVGGQVDGETYRNVYSSLGEPNSVAAMPSLHMGITFLLFLWAFDHFRPLSPLLLVYSLLMGLSLMYLAEHYLLDLVVGSVCAVLCYQAAKRWVPVYENWRPRRRTGFRQPTA
ncbi:MAG: phosphatase PAP2 family protein [Tepidiformaceae bacterium]